MIARLLSSPYIETPMTSSPSSAIALCLAASLALSSCSALSSKCDPAELVGDVNQHILRISAEGEILDPASGEVVRDPLATIEGIADAAIEYLAAQACECAADQRPRLLIHIHGGMTNSKSKVLEVNESLVRIQEDVDAGLIPPTYPIFVVWPSGPLDTYWEHTVLVRQGQRRPWWGATTSPFYFTSDLLQGVAKFPKSFPHKIWSDVLVGAKVGLNRDWNSSWKTAEAASQAYADSTHYDVRVGEFERSSSYHLKRFGMYVLSFVPKLVTQIAVDGMGSGAWEVMRHRLSNVFTPWGDIDLSCGEGPDRARATADGEVPRPKGGVTLLIESLVTRLELDVAPGPPESAFTQQILRLPTPETDAESGPLGDFDVVLVGHSMGAIAINRLLAELEVLQLPQATAIATEGEPDSPSTSNGWRLPITDIVYMAPACSIREASEAVQPFVAHRNQHPRPLVGGATDECRLHVLALHPIAEAGESNFDIAIPRGSLLEWIDTFYTTPDSSLDRTLGKWMNLAPVMHMFEPIHDHFHVKVFGVDGDSIPGSHGDFNQGPFWRPDFWSTDGEMHYDRDWD